MARPRPSSGRSGSQLHVGRYFAALLAVLVGMYAVVVFAGPGSKFLTPKLGLDLQGGAQVILTPETLTGKRANPEQLSTSVDIIRQRVDGAGVSEAEVVTQGDQIVVQVPGGNRSDITNVTKTAQLTMRRVVQAVPVIPPVTATPAPSGSATPAPSASATPKAAVGTPSPTATTNKRPVPAGLVRTAPSASPSASPSATPAASASPSASADPAADVVRSGVAYTEASFAALDCNDRLARQGGAPEVPTKQIAACSKDGVFKYQLDVAKVIGTDVKGASAGTDQNGIQNLVDVTFTGKGQNKFTNLTKEAFGQPSPTDQVAIVLDGVVISAPQIQSVINSQAQISGDFTRKEADDLANVLKFGALPLKFIPGDTEVISPSLGDDQLRSGLIAGGIGLAAVVLYSLLYYRALGVVTVASLGVSALLVYASICILGKQLGLSLSLAGIAGFIVSVGITADSFVVFFERLKDEIKEGRTPRSSVDRAWVRARRTILSADTVSFLAAIILYFVSVGGVRGFAFTLGLSTLLDVAVVFLFTRPLISFLARYAWFSKTRWTGFHGPDGGDPLARAVRKPLAGPALTEKEA